MDEEIKNRMRDRVRADGQVSLEHFLSVVDYFANLSRQCIGIMDCAARRLMYISLNLRHLFEITSVHVKYFDYRDFKNHVSKSELDVIEKACVNLLTSDQCIGLSRLKDCIISCDFHLYTNIDDEGKADDKSILLHLQMLPISFSLDGKITYLLFALCYSPKRHAGPILVREIGHPNYYRYDDAKGTWQEETFVELSETDKEIIRFYTQGKTTSEIATELCRSADSIKTHKSMLYKRFDVDNMAGVVFEALNNGLL